MTNETDYMTKVEFLNWAKNDGMHIKGDTILVTGESGAVQKIVLIENHEEVQ